MDGGAGGEGEKKKKAGPERDSGLPMGSKG
jgi:hypothetical protein